GRSASLTRMGRDCPSEWHEWTRLRCRESVTSCPQTGRTGRRTPADEASARQNRPRGPRGSGPQSASVVYALEVAAQGLFALDRLEQRLEVALAEGRRPVALDHLEEDRRPVLRRLREDLEQVPVLVTVGQDLQP